jgi:hypothetical protein
LEELGFNMSKTGSSRQTFRKQIAKRSSLALSAIREEVAQSKFYVGSHNKVRLRKALASSGRLDLAETTLLTPSVHKIHADRLAERYLRKWVQVRAACHNLDQARARFRFLTLLDCLEIPDPDVAVRTIVAFKDALSKVAADSTGIWMLGVVEVEVVSLEMMRQNRELTTTAAGEMRKLDVCEALLARLPKRQRHLPCYLLIHFHGVVSAVSAYRFDQFEQNLRAVKRWGSVARGIELKRLSTGFKGKSKAIESNLKDIARYITKGGNDWIGNKAYLRYKLSFDARDTSDEDAWVQENWRKNELLKKERIEEGLEDALSLTHSEIACLADVIDRMMRQKKSKTGYLVS